MQSPSYDTLWRTLWGDMQKLGPVHRHIREDIVRRVAALPVESVLDVGCGAGDNVGALARLGHYRVTGVDFSAEAVKIAQDRVPGARFQVVDIEHEALPEQFDLVMTVQVVEHLIDDVSALRNMASMTRKYLFVSTLAGRMRASEVTTGHVRNYSAVELRQKLEVVGMRVLDIRGWGFPWYSPTYRSLIELLPGGPPAGPAGGVSRLAAKALYQVYRTNVPGRGDIISALAEAPS